MIEINFLPWRKKLAKTKKAKFVAALFSCLFLMVILIAAKFVYFERKIIQQEEINKFLQYSNKKLNYKANLFKSLKKERNFLLEKLIMLNNSESDIRFKIAQTLFT